MAIVALDININIAGFAGDKSVLDGLFRRKYLYTGHRRGQAVLWCFKSKKLLDNLQQAHLLFRNLLEVTQILHTSNSYNSMGDFCCCGTAGQRLGSPALPVKNMRRMITD